MHQKASSRMKGNEGFTMVEILAVLLLIGILAAVATPKYLSLVKSARTKAAVSGIAEAKSALSTAYAKLYLDTGSAPAILDVAKTGFQDSSFTSPKDVTFGDIVVNATVGTSNITILAVSVDTSTEFDPSAPSSTWDMPESL